MSDVISFFALLISLGALVLSLFSFIRNHHIKSDDVLTESCRSLLDHAYQVLIKGKQENNFPVADRGQWLTAARAIIQFYKAKDGIKTRPYRDLVENIESVYRFKFGGVLDFHEVRRGRYFDVRNGDEIEPDSAIAVVEFSEWTEGSVDPIDEYCPEKFLSSKNNKARFPSLFNAVSKYQKYKDMIKKANRN